MRDIIIHVAQWWEKYLLKHSHLSILAFNDIYIEYESRGDKDKDLLPKEYLDVIRPYLRDMINNHKAPIKLKDPSGKIIDDDSYVECKIQLLMHISIISFWDTEEIRAMDLKSKHIKYFDG